MSDIHEDGDQSVADDTADVATDEDRFYDTLEEAASALGDDDEGEPDEAAAEADAEAGDEEENPGAVKVTLSDGTEISLGEIEKGYLRQEDYTRKTMEAAQERERVSAYEASLTERARSLESAQQKLLSLVQNLIPPEPPSSLAHQNPAQYVQAMAMRNQALSEMRAHMEAQQETAQAVSGLTEAQQLQHRQAENDLLVKARPALKDAAAMAKFDSEVSGAAKHFGFPDEMIAQTADHRVRQMAYYAAIGLRAEANRKAASRRVEAPRPGKPAPTAQAQDKNRTAMRRLSQTGSISDAMKIDF